MADANDCPGCGAERPADAPQGLCPRCLWQDVPSREASVSAVGAGAAAGLAAEDPQATRAHAPSSAPVDVTGEWSDVPSGPTATAANRVATAPLTRGAAVHYFGDYEVRRELGRGGMGVVYEARQVSLNRLVALKLIKAGLLADDAELRRFQNEAEAVALLDHPGIVAAYEVGEHEGQQYLAMKLVHGESLSSQLGRFRDDPRAAASLVVEAAEAVAHAHSRGILHRDLKPANILVDAEGHPHITDFGLAKRIEADMEMTASGAILGTPAYMAPEQATGHRGGITTATDVYGLGSVLYSLLTSRAPFGGNTVVETLDALRTSAPEPPMRLNARTPRDLETICLKCLEKDPRRRYASAQALADDLRAWLESRPITARRVGPAERAWLWCKRRPAVAALLAAVAIAILGGTATTLAVQARANRALLGKNRELTDAYRREAKVNADLVAANQRVEQRFELAQDAIRTFHTGVSEDFMLREQNLNPLRKKLLAAARSFYLRLEDQLRGQSDRASRAALARTYGSVAKLSFQIDSAEAALVTYQKAMALLREQIADGSAEPDTRADLVESLLGSAEVLTAMQKAAEATSTVEESVSLARGLAKAHPENERYQEILGRSLGRQGNSLWRAGSEAEALEFYRQEEKVYQGLLEAHPDELTYLSGAANSAVGVGTLLRKQGLANEGEAVLKRALALHERLTQAEPGNVLSQNSYAQACNNMGAGFSNPRSEEALAYFRKAEDIWRRAVAGYPNSLFLHNNLGFIQHNIAGRLCVLGRPDEQIGAYVAESAAYERAARSDPSNPVFANEVADTQEKLSLLLFRAGRTGEALAAVKQAMEIYEQLARSHPDFQPGSLISCRFKLGELLRAAGQTDEAAAVYEQVLSAHEKALAAEGDRATPSTLRALGMSLGRLGRTAESAANFRRTLATIQNATTPNWFELARTKALLAGVAAEAGSGLTADEGETHAAEAVEALRRHAAGRHATVDEAAASGYLDVTLVDMNPQFDVLRGREDFRQLLREMRGQGPEPAPSAR